MSLVTVQTTDSFEEWRVKTNQIAVQAAGNPVQSFSTITVTASPFTYTNSSSNYKEQIIVRNGTISQLQFVRGGDTALLPVLGVYLLNPGDQLVVTYSSAPTMTKIPV